MIDSNLARGGELILIGAVEGMTMIVPSGHDNDSCNHNDICCHHDKKMIPVRAIKAVAVGHCRNHNASAFLIDVVIAMIAMI